MKCSSLIHQVTLWIRSVKKILQSAALISADNVTELRSYPYSLLILVDPHMRIEEDLKLV